MREDEIVFDQADLTDRERQIVLAMVALTTITMDIVAKRKREHGDAAARRSALESMTKVMNQCLPGLNFRLRDSAPETH